MDSGVRFVVRKNKKKEKNSGKTGFGKYAAVLLEYDVAGQEKGVKGKWSVGNRNKIVLRVKSKQKRHTFS